MIFGMVANAGGSARCNGCDERLSSLHGRRANAGQRSLRADSLCGIWLSDRRAIHGVKGFGFTLFPKARMAFEETCAAVPAKNGIIVTGGPNRFGLLEAPHRLFEERGEGERRPSSPHLSLGPPFMQETGIVETFVGVDERLEKSLCFAMTIMGVAPELVGDGEAEQTQRQLVFRIDCQDIAADRFGLFRLVERAVDFRFRDSFGNTSLRNGLQLEFHLGTSCAPVKPARCSE